LSGEVICHTSGKEKKKSNKIRKKTNISRGKKGLGGERFKGRVGVPRKGGRGFRSSLMTKKGGT